MQTTQTPLANSAPLPLTGELRAFAWRWAPMDLLLWAQAQYANVRERRRDPQAMANELFDLARRCPHAVCDGYREAAVHTRALCAAALALGLPELAQAARIIQDGGSVAFTLTVSSEFSIHSRLLTTQTLVTQGLLQGQLSSAMLGLQQAAVQDIHQALLGGGADLYLDPRQQTYPAGAEWAQALRPVHAYLRARAAETIVPEDKSLLLPADEAECRAVQDAFTALYIQELRRVMLVAVPATLKHLSHERPDLKPLWPLLPVMPRRERLPRTGRTQR